MKEMLVIIDMVNGFVNEGALADKKIKKIVPCIENLINVAKAKNMDIVAFKDCHEEFDEEFKIFPPHCIKNTTESQLIDELLKFKQDMILIDKNTTNGFVTKDFQNLIKQYYENIYVCGCCTDICVQNFVESYLNHIKSNNLGTKIHVINDGCYTFDNKNHSAEQTHNKAIMYMKSLGAQID